MINLSLLQSCPSVRNKITQTGALLFCTDTRKYNHPSAFIAIPGTKVNPLDVIDGILKKNCPIVVYQEDKVNEDKVSLLRREYPLTEFIAVSDSVTFLQELTHLHVKEWKRKNSKRTVFAISGSNGKTTHKEMLSHMLKEVLPGKVVSTDKNNNNHLGVPLTLLGVNEDTEFVVLELGSNHPGEIKVLCEIAEPNAGITTNIGATHLEFFGSEEKVFEEEAYLYHSVVASTQGKGFFLVNRDDLYLKSLSLSKGSISYGIMPGGMAQVTILAQGADIVFKGKRLVVKNEFITGDHNKLNLITCLFIACHFYPELEEDLKIAATQFRPTRNRSQWISFQDRSIYLDAYNANPSSMKAALQGFKESVEDRGLGLENACIVLGDMNELGEATPQYHKDVGRYVKELGFKNVYFIGKYAIHYLAGYPEGQGRSSCTDFKEEYRLSCLSRYHVHFIKGSRSLQLESLFDIT
jgi:UDP-N-acetylmuramoyl-tripeptide--D-alanyl-D-alanine ligase